LRVANAAATKLSKVLEEAECVSTQTVWDLGDAADAATGALIGTTATAVAIAVHSYEVQAAIDLAALSAVDETACATRILRIV
jgi:hypothetical protein